MVTNTNPTFTPEHLRFLSYIRAVGTGPKGNRPLTYDEAKDALHLILQRLVPDTAISAFLLGWRVQGERDEELQGCIDYLAEQLLPKCLEGVEIGYPMDGKAKFYPIMLHAAALISDITFHAVYDLPLGPKYGESLDNFDITAPNLRLHNRRDLLPGISDLTGLRNDIGVRTAFNTIEKLNFLAPVALIGMHHAPYFDLYSSLYAKYYRRLIIVQGHEGTPEILKKTKYKLVENGEISTHSIDPEAFGIEPIGAKEEMNLETMHNIIRFPDDNLAKMVRLNAAFLGFSAGKYTTIEEGYACLQD